MTCTFGKMKLEGKMQKPPLPILPFISNTSSLHFVICAHVPQRHLLVESFGCLFLHGGNDAAFGVAQVPMSANRPTNHSVVFTHKLKFVVVLALFYFVLVNNEVSYIVSFGWQRELFVLSEYNIKLSIKNGRSPNMPHLWSFFV